MQIGNMFFLGKGTIRFHETVLAGKHVEIQIREIARSNALVFTAILKDRLLRVDRSDTQVRAIAESADFVDTSKALAIVMAGMKACIECMGQLEKGRQELDEAMALDEPAFGPDLLAV